MSGLYQQKGIYFVDKPTGVTSHQVVNWFRRQTGIKRIGHTGTLDPLATGLLIILVGREFTKKQAEFLKQDKKYECTVQLGVETDSYDIDGQVVSTASDVDVLKISEQQLRIELRSFQGKIEQKVPAFSAVKQKGKKLYELARKQVITPKDLPTRVVEIYSLDLLDFYESKLENRQIKLINTNSKIYKLIKFSTHCSSGTYIRSIAHDLGRKLGVGATVVELRRTAIGSISLENALFCPLINTKKL